MSWQYPEKIYYHVCSFLDTDFRQKEYTVSLDSDMLSINIDVEDDQIYENKESFILMIDSCGVLIKIKDDDGN